MFAITLWELKLQFKLALIEKIVEKVRTIVEKRLTSWSN